MHWLLLIIRLLFQWFIIYSFLMNWFRSCSKLGRYSHRHATVSTMLPKCMGLECLVEQCEQNGISHIILDKKALPLSLIPTVYLPISCPISLPVPHLAYSPHCSTEQTQNKVTRTKCPPMTKYMEDSLQISSLWHLVTVSFCDSLSLLPYTLIYNLAFLNTTPFVFASISCLIPHHCSDVLMF